MSQLDKHCWFDTAWFLLAAAHRHWCFWNSRQLPGWRQPAGRRRCFGWRHSRLYRHSPLPSGACHIPHWCHTSRSGRHSASDNQGGMRSRRWCQQRWCWQCCCSCWSLQSWRWPDCRGTKRCSRQLQTAGSHQHRLHWEYLRLGSEPGYRSQLSPHPWGWGSSRQAHQPCLLPRQESAPAARKRLQQQKASGALGREICAHDAERTQLNHQPYPSFTTGA